MGKFIDLTGQTFGRLTVIGQAGYHYLPSGQRDMKWLCKCSCGNPVLHAVVGHSLKQGRSTSCGCYSQECRSKIHLKDLTGQKFGQLTVIAQTDYFITKSGKRRVMWLCECECGRQLNVRTNDLKSGNTQTCGKCKYENRYEEKGDYIIGYTNTGARFFMRLH